MPTASSAPCVLTVMEQLGRGGAERALVLLLPELQKMGLRCEVAALRAELGMPCCPFLRKIFSFPPQ